MYCPSCGKSVEENVKFCMSCGANLESAEAPQTAPSSGIPMGASPLSGNEFIIEQKIAAMRDTYGIKDRNGNVLAYVKRKIASVGPQFWFETPNETRFGEMRGKVLTVRPTFEIYDNQGLVAVVKKKVLKLLGSEWWLEDPSGNEKARIKGNITAHDFTIESPSGSDIAQIHKKWKTVRDSYGIEIAGQELTPYVVIAYVIAMDHAEYKRGKGFGFGAGGIRFGT